MASREKRNDLYDILGVSKDCSSEALKLAYKKLAMRWHPDKCSNSSNSICMEEANQKFQKIQGAYSVLSDSNKRFLYDVGAYDGDDEDSNTGLSEILDEVIEMMKQTKPSENGQESLDELQKLYDEIFFPEGNTGCGASNVENRFNGSDASTSSRPSVSTSDPALAKPDKSGPDVSQFFSEPDESSQKYKRETQ